MRKLWWLLPVLLLLSGCAAEETFETVADELVQPVMSAPAQIDVRLPDDAAVPVLESDGAQLYLCQDYEILIEILPGGDLAETVRQISGYDRENLTMVQTRSEGVTRWEFVWASAGEEGDRLGRAVILDDGSYHYCMSALRSAQDGEETQTVWNDVFASFRLA